MIYYGTGDATEPHAEVPYDILHIVNDEGVWGAGFVVPLGQKYPKAKETYQNNVPSLGHNQVVTVSSSVRVVNMCAQGMKPTEWRRLVRYDALAECLYDYRRQDASKGRIVVMPRIGAGIGDGRWRIIEAILEVYLPDLEVYVFDLP